MTQQYKPSDINVLIACEESQTECLAFRELGFNAYSCDVQPCRHGGNPYWHIQGDVRPLLRGDTAFNVQAGYLRCVDRWHLIVAHPPCTYLCRVSSVWMRAEPLVQVFDNGRVWSVNPDRYAAMLEGRAFFQECLAADVPFLAVENPIPMSLAGLPKPQGWASPHWFGEKWTKTTYYWLKNLPPLFPVLIHPAPREWVRSHRGKYRSRTLPKLGAAVASQWGQYVLEQLNKP